MRASKDEMKVVLTTPKFTFHEAVWGDMHAGFETYHQEVDLSPLFKGLPQNMCQAPHWGYVIKGEYRVLYADGHKEIYRTGDAYYMPPGHSPAMSACSEII